MIKLTKYLLFILILLAFSELKAQVIRTDTIVERKIYTISVIKVRTMPKYIIELNGNLHAGALELTGHNGGFSRNGLINGKNFGTRTGIGGDLTFKMALNKKGQFWLDILAGYQRFQSNLFVDNDEEGKVSYDVIMGGIGAEFRINPAHKVKYYIGLNTLMSSISGNATIINPPPGNTYDIKINSGFRIGYSLFTGFNYSVSDDFGLNLGIKYSHLNLILKKSAPILDQYETEFNDDSVDEPILYAGWKQFAYTSVFTGVSYFFGVKERRYRLN